MKKIFFLLILFIGAISCNCDAQTLAEMKGTFSGECDGLYCYLILDPTASSIETKGCLVSDSKTHEFVKVSSKPINIKCNGKFVLRQSGTDMIYNVLAVHESDEIDPAGMVIAFEDDTNTDNLIYINISSKDGGKSLQLFYMNDDDNPLFETATLERDK